MGNYVFDAEVLIDAVLRDGELPDSNHDMGGDIVPDFVSRGEAAVYDLNRNDVPGSTDRDRYYWRDVGTIDSFFDAHQDLISALPDLQPLQLRRGRSSAQQLNSPPAKFVRDAQGTSARRSTRSSSLGSVLSGAHIERSVLGPWVSIGSRRDGRQLDPVRPGHASGECHGAQRYSGQGSRRRARRDRRGRRRSRSGPRLHRHRSGITVVGKGVHVA